MGNTNHTDWQREGLSIFQLHPSGKYTKNGEPEMCNRFWGGIYPDRARGVTDEEAEIVAQRIIESENVLHKTGLTASELLQQRDELLSIINQGRDMCDKLKFPTESELKEFSAKANTLIQKIENHES